MKKFIRMFLVLILLFITGCDKDDYAIGTIDYELNIGLNYQEKIVFVLPKNAYDLADKNKDEDYTSLEYSLLYGENEPIFSNHNERYNKKIDKDLDKVVVTLDYGYAEDDFIYSNYIMNCFEDYNIVSNDDSFEIDLSGEFYCLNDRLLNISVISSYDVIDSNGTNVDNRYVWQINQNNYTDVNIRHKISRDYDSMEETIDDKGNSIWPIVKNVLGILIVVILLIGLYKFYKRQQEV